jgi:hypothetical protein
MHHPWVLLPGLPIHLWNEATLMAIGNSLGSLISVDSHNLNASTRKVAQLLVEIEIHHGLPKVLEIDLWGRKTIQRLDYIGIPFRCNICHCTGHLSQDCKGWDSVDSIEDMKPQENLYNSSPEATTSDFRVFFFSTEVTNPSSPLKTLTGKLHSHCSMFSSTLTCMEKETLDASEWLKRNTSFEGRPSEDTTVVVGPVVGDSF